MMPSSSPSLYRISKELYQLLRISEVLKSNNLIAKDQYQEKSIQRIEVSGHGISSH
jgi:hypothetical protein